MIKNTSPSLGKVGSLQYGNLLMSAIVVFCFFTSSVHAALPTSNPAAGGKEILFGIIDNSIPLILFSIALLITVVLKKLGYGNFAVFTGTHTSLPARKVAIDPGTALLRVNSKMKVEYTNRMFQHITGSSEDDLVGKSVREALSANGMNNTDIETLIRMVKKQFNTPEFGLVYGDINVEKNGDLQVLHVSTHPVMDKNNKITGVAILNKNFSEQKKELDKLIGQAERDHLTGLLNRMGFEKFLDAFPGNSRQGSKNVMCYLDLDNFKPVNDSAGHTAGDELLKQIADIFRQHVRNSDLLARTGGDEFVVLFPDCPIEKARARLENMINSVSSLRFSWGDKSFVVGVSIGAVEFDSGISIAALHDLCKIADEACYMAKQKGRNQLFIYDSAHPAKAIEHLGKDNWQDIIRNALDGDAFKLFVQTIIPLSNAKHDGKKRYEVYVRLPHMGRMLRPGSFFPAAERYGLSRAIDRWVVRKTFEKIAQIKSQTGSLEGREFTVNLSLASLLDEGFAKFIAEMLNQFEIQAHVLCFEVSESDVVSNFSQARKLLTKLAEMGCSNSLDDFGSGLSALNYIRDLPLHYLKIDGVFVRNIETSQIDAAMIHALNHMSKVMNLKTIAEFVEDEHTAKLLRRLGVDYAQGYYCGRPLPLDRLEVPKATV